MNIKSFVKSLAFTACIGWGTLNANAHGVNEQLTNQKTESIDSVLSLTNFSPMSGGIGSEVMITGGGFSDVSSVEFRGIPTSFSILNDSTIAALVPAKLKFPGKIRIKIDSPFQKVVSLVDFSPVPMAIAGFSPDKAPAGATITVTGASFTGVVSAEVRGIATNFTILNDSVLSLTVPNNLPYQPGNIRLKKSDSTFEKAVSSETFMRIANEPTIAATNLRADPAFTVTRLEWKNGDGNRRLVVLKEAANPDNFVPEDGIVYPASSFVSLGDSASGNFFVFNGKPDEVRITGLEITTTYEARIYEYKGAGDRINYLTSSFDSVSFTTREPEDPVIDRTIPECINPGSTVTLKGRNLEETSVVVMNNDSLLFTIVNDQTLLVQIPADAMNGNIAITAMDLETILGMDTTFNRLEILPAEPTSSSANLTVLINPANPTAAEINWDKGDGDRHLVVMRPSSNFFSFVPEDCDFYSANSTFGAGQDKNGNFVVYGGAGTSVTVDSLTENTSYDVFVFDYNKSEGKVQNYLVTEVLQGSFTTPQADTTSAKSANTLSSANQSSDLSNSISADFNSVSEVMAFPNPTIDGLVNIVFNGYEGKSPVAISVFDLSGGVVFSEKFVEKNKIELNFNELKGKGLYVVKAIVNGKQHIKRIFVK